MTAEYGSAGKGVEAMARRSRAIPQRRYLLFFLIIAVLGLSAVLATAEAAPQDEAALQDSVCLGCHPPTERISGHRRLDVSKLGESTCLRCHQPHSAAVALATGGTMASSISLPQASSGNCVACHYQFGPLQTARYLEEGKLVHDPVAKGLCNACHQPHGKQGKAELMATARTLCLGCHQELASKGKMIYQHRPFGGGQCTSCHDPHISENQGLIRAEIGILCRSCHPGLEGNITKAVSKHSPYAQGQCTACHDPHASDNKSQLAESPTVLCLTCHQGIGQELLQPVRHFPFASRNCLSCHASHAAQGKKLLKASKQEDLCARCHPALQKALRLNSHHPVGTVIACTSCHRPHGSTFQGLRILPGNNLCISCHRQEKEFYDRIGHSKMEAGSFPGSCTNCHVPHGSSFSNLLKKELLNLCLACHQAMGLMPLTHPVGEGYLDPVKNIPLTCSSTCHGPHGTSLKFSLTKTGDDLCLTCHTDKRKEGVKKS